jgi:hypothetical protein
LMQSEGVANFLQKLGLHLVGFHPTLGFHFPGGVRVSTGMTRWKGACRGVLGRLVTNGQETIKANDDVAFAAAA